VPALWADLASPDADKAYRAMAALADDPDGAVPFLKEKLRPAVALDRKEIARRVKDLDSPVYATRQRAMRGLAWLHEEALPDLEEVLEGKPTEEVRRRVKQLVERARRQGPPPARLWMLRAVEVLEQAGTPEARRLLQVLARQPVVQGRLGDGRQHAHQGVGDARLPQEPAA
jgi:hypothetical protein